MGGGTSKNFVNNNQIVERKPRQVIQNCPVIKNHQGKFLLQTLINMGKSTDGSGGLYLSCNPDGFLVGSTSENDPELWKLLYIDQSSLRNELYLRLFITGRLYFRIFNTGSKRIIHVNNEDLSISCIPYDDTDKSNNTITSNSLGCLFFMRKHELLPNLTYYKLCTVDNLCLVQTADGSVSLCKGSKYQVISDNKNSDDLSKSFIWQLMPSF